MTEPQVNLNAETHELTEIRVIIQSMIKGLESGPKSRERALVITKLQEANMWAVEAMTKA